MLAMRPVSWPLAAMLLLTAAAIIYWLWFGLTQRYVVVDDILSLQAAKSILEHGISRFPSGYLYLRGYPIHYMVAGSIRVFGISSFSVMLPSLLMALGSLWITFLFAKDILGRPWLGVIAVVLLISLDMQIFYATSPRMYMTFQFFSMLAFYSGWRAFINNEGRFRLVTFLAVGAAILTHVEAGILMVSIPVSLALFQIFKERKIPSVSPSSLYSPQIVIGILVVALVVVFRYIYPIPGEMPLISDHGGLPPGSNEGGLNLNPINWAGHIFNLERALPFGLPLMLATLFLVVTGIRHSKDKTAINMVYLVLLLSISALGLFLNTTKTNPRLWMFVLPIYALILSYGLAAIWGVISTIRKKGSSQNLLRGAMIASLLVFGVALNLGLLSFAENTSYSDLVVQGYGLPCTQATTCDTSTKRYYEDLQQMIGPDDLIVTTNAHFTYYHLGRADGYLRERRLEDGGFTTFEQPRDEYYGIPLIDTIAKLQGFLEERRRVFVIADGKIQTFVSPEIAGFLKENFMEFYKGDRITTYVNCIAAPCGLQIESLEVGRP